MKGVFKCIKFLTFSITLALCFVLFSADTSALTFTQEVTPTGNSWITSSNARAILSDGTILSGNSYGIMTMPSYINVTNVRGIYRSGNIDVVEGNYYTFLIGMRTDQGNTSFVWRNYWNESDDFTILSVEEIEKQQIAEANFCAYYQSIGNNNYQCNQTTVSGAASSWYRVWLRSNVSGSRQIRVGGTTMGTIIQGVAASIMMGDIFEYNPVSPVEQMNQKDEEDRANIESQQSDSESGADESQGDAEQQGTTLLAAFTSFVSALTSATPSNCRIDMDLGNLDMGNVDLCQLSPPAGFSALASVFMILFCVPLSIATARKVISLFRSFQ